MTSSPLKMPFFWFYWGVSIVLWVVSTPFLLLLSFKKKYKNSLLSRFFLKNNPSLPRGSVWFHACSLGEVTSLEPLLVQGEYPLVVSTTTQTGFDYAKRYKNVHRCYLPFEPFLIGWMNAPRVIVVTEAELWPMIFFGGKITGAKVIYINARMSERSLKRAKKIAFIYQMMFDRIDHVYAQSEEDGKRLELLGAKNVTIFGNIKRFRPIVASQRLTPPKSRVIVAASTHEGEEELILEAYKTVRDKQEAKLVIVPRHPERFEKVLNDVTKWGTQHGYSTASYHRDGWSGEWDIMVVDVMGELLSMYAIAHTVVLGGTFVPVGGHNPLEPASFQTKLIVGPSVYNQKELFKYIEHYYSVTDDQLAKVLCQGDTLNSSSVKHEGGFEMLKGEIYG